MPIRPNSFDAQKALEVILLLAERLDDPTFHSIAKVLYRADHKHLQKYGRFICGDRYIAMDYGPVPSRIYDILKVPLQMAPIAADESVRAAFRVVGGRRSVQPLRSPRMDTISASELEAIAEAIADWGQLSFDERTERSHGPAYTATAPNAEIAIEAIVNELPNADEVLEYLRG